MKKDYFVPQIIPVEQAVKELRHGKVIAYPTEAVYGLGCDPFNEEAVMNLLAVKQRDVSKGLLLIAASWGDVSDLVAVDKLTTSDLADVFASWPGPTTWIFPATNKVPLWIRGEHSSIAIRITSHPTARALCQAYEGPMVSTSANIASQSPCRTQRELIRQFVNKIQFVVQGRVGRLKKPTSIYDVLTRESVRA